MSIDWNRIPREISHAKCLCDRCLGDNDGNHQCERILQHMTVLRRAGCRRGQYVWIAEQQRVVVGCTCAEAKQAI